MSLICVQISLDCITVLASETVVAKCKTGVIFPAFDVKSSFKSLPSVLVTSLASGLYRLHASEPPSGRHQGLRAVDGRALSLCVLADQV